MGWSSSGSDHLVAASLNPPRTSRLSSVLDLRRRWQEMLTSLFGSVLGSLKQHVRLVSNCSFCSVLAGLFFYFCGVVAQFPPSPEGVKILKSKFHHGIEISYKEVKHSLLQILYYTHRRVSFLNIARKLCALYLTTLRL